MSNYRSSYRIPYRPGGGYRVGAYGDGLSSPAPDLPTTNLAIRFSAQNLDGLNNTSLVDGQGLATIVNLGAAGATYNQAQATGANQPVYLAVAQAGKINNKSAIQGSSTRGMVSGAVASIAQPTTMFCLLKAKSSQSGGMMCDGVNQMQWGLILLQTRLYAGAVGATGQSVTIGNWQLVVAQFNGASSFGRMDGAQSGAVNPAAGGSGTEFNFMQSSAGAFRLDADVAEFMVYNALLTAPQIAVVEAALAGIYGSTPQ